MKMVIVEIMMMVMMIRITWMWRSVRWSGHLGNLCTVTLFKPPLSLVGQQLFSSSQYEYFVSKSYIHHTLVWTVIINAQPAWTQSARPSGRSGWSKGRQSVVPLMSWLLLLLSLLSSWLLLQLISRWVGLVWRRRPRPGGSGSPPGCRPTCPAQSLTPSTALQDYFQPTLSSSL